MTERAVERKDLHVPFTVLAERGFEALPLERARRRSDIRDLPAMVRHPLNFLADIRDSYRFAEFEDEMVPFAREGLVFDLFATKSDYAFLFVGRDDGRVCWQTDWSPDGSGPTFEIVNTSLAAFAKCFCLEKSICFRIRSQLAESAAGFDANTADKAEAELRACLETTDPAALASIYWSTILGEIGEGFYQALPTLTHLLAREAWRRNAEPEAD